MGTLTAHGVSVQEYLSNPAYEHHEWIDGTVRELNLGNELHSITQVNCVLLLGPYLRANRLGFLYTELHCRLPKGAQKKFYLPDVAVVLGDRRQGSYMEGAPDLVVEIRSPSDTMSAAAVRKMEEWLEAGSRLGWLVLPEEQELWVFTPGERPRVLAATDRVDGGTLLPGLEFPVSGLFEA